MVRPSPCPLPEGEREFAPLSQFWERGLGVRVGRDHPSPNRSSGLRFSSAVSGCKGEASLPEPIP